MKFLLPFFSSLLLPFLLYAQSSPGSAYLDLSLYSEYETAYPGQETRLGLLMDLTEGWHTYWMNPGDSGIPVSVKWEDVPEGIEVGETQWPYPYQFREDRLVTHGYKDESMLLFPVSVSDELPEGNYILTARIEFLVCREACIPGFETLTYTLTISNNQNLNQSDQAPLFERYASKVPVPADVVEQTSLKVNGDEIHFSMTGDFSGWTDPEELVFFTMQDNMVESAAGQKITVSDGRIDISLKKSIYQSGNVNALSGVLVLPDGNNPKALTVSAESD